MLRNDIQIEKYQNITEFEVPIIFYLTDSKGKYVSLSVPVNGYDLIGIQHIFEFDYNFIGGLRDYRSNHPRYHYYIVMFSTMCTKLIESFSTHNNTETINSKFCKLKYLSVVVGKYHGVVKHLGDMRRCTLKCPLFSNYTTFTRSCHQLITIGR